MPSSHPDDGKQPKTFGFYFLKIFLALYIEYILISEHYGHNVTDSDGFLYFVKYTFSFGFSVGFEGNNKYAKKVLLRHGMR